METKDLERKSRKEGMGLEREQTFMGLHLLGSVLSLVKSFHQEGVISRPYQMMCRFIKQNLCCRLKAISSSAGSMQHLPKR